MVKLYNIFNHWYHGGVIWIISDTHFEDDDCLLMDRHWITPDEQVALINAKVGKKDTLIHLGDVGNINYIKQLKGYKVLVTGNHDQGATIYQKKWGIEVNHKYLNTIDPKALEYVNDKWFDTYEEAQAYKDELEADFVAKFNVIDNKLFDEVYDGPLFINEKIMLSHEPIELPFGINIHGHNHSGPKKILLNGFVSINMAANVCKYTPERLDKLIEGCKVNDLHRITVDWATKNSLKKKK